ncbi:hypothetical protein [Cutibacterium sp.]|uniref:hypothetical protein n=1 Tax=Cutibacterium sp. TaxID=1912221 RepID=UPI0026DC091F|nr:hypothetical protein [Cutibacterium sp.]MDO4413275.1 hypothetical protein [Cutibacterium sp.]
MIVFIIAMILILAVALGVCAMVMFGLRHPGDGSDGSFWRHTATRVGEDLSGVRRR